MRTLAYATLVAGTAITIAITPAGAQTRQTDDSFRWTARAADGQWLFVRNLNGGVRIERSTGNQIEVRAVKTWRRGDPADVRVEVTRYGPNGRDVLVCAMWGDESVCTEREYRSRRSGGQVRNNDVNVQFIISVPAGVHIRGETVNGNVDITGATGQVRANSVNGNINATSTGGPVEARTVNGNVRAVMGELQGTENLTYAAVNGNVMVEFSGDLNAELEMSTVNGGFETNFPLLVRGRINPRSIRTTVGTGGRTIKLSTTNGNVELRRR